MDILTKNIVYAMIKRKISKNEVLKDYIMLKNRHLLQLIICSIIGMAIGTIFPLYNLLSIVFVIICIVSFIITFILLKKDRIKSKIFFSLLLVIISLLSYSYSSFYCNNKYPQNIYSKNEIFVEGIIIDSNSRYLDIKVVGENDLDGLKIRIYNPKNKNNVKTTPFQKCEFKLKLKDCPIYIKASGISFYGSGEILHSEDISDFSIQKSAFKTRHFLSTNIKTLFSESKTTYSFINAIILGETSELSDGMYADYGRLGITHIISVSGLHFTIIIMSILKLLCLLHIKQKIRCSICIPLAIFYCLVTGASPSSVRALIMIIIYLLGKIFLYSPDSLTSLSVAGFIIIFLNPFSIYSTSFILSFLATFAIIISPSFFNNKSHSNAISRLKNILQSITITLIISMFITPTLYNRFQTFSLITPLANLILSIVFAPIKMSENQDYIKIFFLKGK
jgi:competence protein ComEC